MSRHQATPNTDENWTGWHICEAEDTPIADVAYVDDADYGPKVGEANAKLILAAPAFALAWELVPQEIKDKIFDALHKPDTEWVEQAIRGVS